MHNRNSSSDTSMIFAIIAIGLGVMGLILPSVSNFYTKAQANDTFCRPNPLSQISQACLDTYCTTNLIGSPTPCQAIICMSTGQRISTFTTTSTTFVTVLSSADNTNCSTTSNPSPIFFCMATFNFRTNSITG